MAEIKKLPDSQDTAVQPIMQLSSAREAIPLEEEQWLAGLYRDCERPKRPRRSAHTGRWGQP